MYKVTYYIDGVDTPDTIEVETRAQFMVLLSMLDALPFVSRGQATHPDIPTVFMFDRDPNTGKMIDSIYDPRKTN